MWKITNISFVDYFISVASDMLLNVQLKIEYYFTSHIVIAVKIKYSKQILTWWQQVKQVSYFYGGNIVPWDSFKNNFSILLNKFLKCLPNTLLHWEAPQLEIKCLATWGYCFKSEWKQNGQFLATYMYIVKNNAGEIGFKIVKMRLTF